MNTTKKTHRYKKQINGYNWEREVGRRKTEAGDEEVQTDTKKL